MIALNKKNLEKLVTETLAIEAREAKEIAVKLRTQVESFILRHDTVAFVEKVKALDEESADVQEAEKE